MVCSLFFVRSCFARLAVWWPRFTRVSAKDSRKDFEKHPLEHVLSFQRRILACKRFFLARGKRTPLGIMEDSRDL